MDLSKLSNEDLQAIAAKDMSKVSEAGLRLISGAPDPIDDKELAQFRAQGFQGTKEDLQRDKSQFESTKGQHSYALQAARDVPVGAVGGITGLADLATMPIRAIRKGEEAIARKFGANIPDSGPWFPSSAAVTAPLDQALATQANTPQTGPQRLARDLTRGASGALATMGLGAGIGGPTSALAANPGLQLTSALTGSTASGLTREAGGGKVAQTIAGLLGGLAPGGIKYATERLIGEPNAAGQTLLNKGVDLPAGAQKAGGAYSQIEDASTNLPIIGSQFQKAKDAAQAQAKEAFILEGAAPGSKVSPTGDLQQTLENVGDTFVPAYDKVSGFPLVLQKGQPVIVNQGANTPLSAAFARAVADKSIDASTATRQQASGWLSNLLTRPIKNSEDLISMRSEIRYRINALAKDTSSEVMARREIYQSAADKVTQALESQLPPNLMQNLKAVDAQYAKYKTAVDTMAKGGDRPGGFTWAEASQAAKSSAQGALGKDAYARGEGFMREIPAAAREAFAMRPQTGATLASKGAAYAALPLTIPLSLTQGGRAFAANNRLNPYAIPPSAISEILAQALQGNQ